MVHRILVCGSNETLVETRCRILEKAGYEVTACNAHTAKEEISATKKFDLLILCSSLSRDEQLSLIEISHEERPGKKNLIVYAGNPDDRLSSSADVSFPAFDGPVRFVTQVISLIGT
jgi:DNA-binding response OmpR family regulator